MFGPNPAKESLDAVNAGIDVEAFQTAVRNGHNDLQKRLLDQIGKNICIGLAETRQVDRRNKRAVETAQDICNEQNWQYDSNRH